MTIKLYDTMTRSLREFVPIHDNTVNMYVCGPTVYNYIHIGNARSVVAFDTIRRYFEYRGYKVNYISNFTDVDDKIIKGAAEAGMDTKSFSDKFIAAFMEDVKQLGVKPATKNPRVIDYMDEIIDFVSNSRSFLPHFHIPLQGGTNFLLERMKRKYNREGFE